jgi:hypothetical protein
MYGAGQRFYGSPEHGANRDGASWKVLGIAERQLLL